MILTLNKAQEPLKIKGDRVRGPVYRDMGGR